MAEVIIENHHYEPDELRISAGTDVDFRNEDTDVHTITADDDSFDSGEISPGNDYHYLFDSPGECGIHCELHPDMKMTIFVE
jgi:plastocyanin